MLSACQCSKCSSAQGLLSAANQAQTRQYEQQWHLTIRVMGWGRGGVGLIIDLDTELKMAGYVAHCLNSTFTGFDGIGTKWTHGKVFMIIDCAVTDKVLLSGCCPPSIGFKKVGSAEPQRWTSSQEPAG